MLLTLSSCIRSLLARLFGALLIVLVVAADPAAAARIVVFGDSWGVPAAPALQAVLIAEALPATVFGAAVSGETAANLSSTSGLQHITDSLAANPDADLVHLSIGGNDFLGQWNSGFTTAQEIALIQAIAVDVEIIVDHILSVRPGVQILLSSYDYPRPLPIGTPTEVNAIGTIAGAAFFALADTKGAGLTYADFNGLMQVLYGFDGTQPTPYDPPFVIPPGDPSLPDPTLPGPAAAFADSIHLTSVGYALLAEAQYSVFYGPILKPIAAVPFLTLATRGVLVSLIVLAAAATALRRRNLERLAG
jgi:lysophospholipase L1-like esterase